MPSFIGAGAVLNTSRYYQTTYGVVNIGLDKQLRHAEGKRRFSAPCPVRVGDSFLALCCRHSSMICAEYKPSQGPSLRSAFDQFLINEWIKTQFGQLTTDVSWFN